MRRILVIHEELHEAKEIERFITSCYGTCKVTLCVNVSEKEIMDIIERHGNEMDICFTMIKMKSISGMQIAESLRKRNNKIKIVFISDTDEYALDAWRLGINSYLLRPVTMDNIKKTIRNM